MKLVPTLFSLLAVLGAASAGDVRGVDPAVAARYVPSAEGTFACLDGSSVIPFSAVNDDYCDCADGSDEPGTSACEGRSAAYFFCWNRGHIPGKVLASRVNDGICDPECCDGSDEWASGACPDRCAEISKVHREKVDAEQKTRRTGAKIRSTYVSFAQKEKTRLEEELAAKRAEVADKELEVEEAKAALDRAESQSRDAIERKKQSPLYQSVEKHRDVVKRLKTDVELLKDDLKTVLDLLEELSKGYNPNGQDMAVKHAVINYKELIGRVEVPETPKEGVEGEEANAEAQVEGGEPEAAAAKLNHIRNPDGEIPNWQVDDVLRQDLEGLLVSNDGDDDDDEDGLLYRLEEYIPDSMFEYYDTAREAIVSWLTDFGVIKRKQVAADGPHVATARDKHRAAERSLTDTRSRIRDIETTLDQISTQKHYGPQGEWKKLDGTCIDTVAGDYTYELCFFGGARQKSNKDSSSNSLGSFAGWNTEGERGSYGYYTKQRYRNGAKCWNGPERAVNVELSCGTTNAILSVTEPEKCEYKFKVTTPALCWPLEGDKPAPKAQAAQAQDAVKDEL